LDIGPTLVENSAPREESKAKNEESDFPSPLACDVYEGVGLATHLIRKQDMTLRYPIGKITAQYLPTWKNCASWM